MTITKDELESHSVNTLNSLKMLDLSEMERIAILAIAFSSAVSELATSDGDISFNMACVTLALLQMQSQCNEQAKIFSDAIEAAQKG